MAVTEQQLAACVVDYYSQLPGWRVYHEVSALGGVADLVATNGLLIHVVEVKKSQSLALLDQLLGWRGMAHLISAAVPAPKRTSCGGRAFRWALRQGGFGLFELRPEHSDACHETLRPELCRKITAGVSRFLCEEQLHPEEWAHAGAAGGGHYTPFKATCRSVLGYVKRHPGCTMKAIVDNIGHHYASDAGARSSLATWIREGKVPGVKKGEHGYHLA